MNQKILIIEDNTEVRENIAEILTLSDYHVLTATNGKEGVEIARREIPDLILCDIMMPTLDGYGVLKIISEDPTLNQKPFIFLTARTEKEDLRRGMGLGADDYITKPFDDLSLLEAIQIRLKKSVSSSDSMRSDFLSQNLLKSSLQHILQDTDIIDLRDKDVIYNHSKTPRWIYHIKSGRVKHVHTNEMGKEIILEVWKEGDFFGLEAPYMDNRYFGSTLAFGDAVIQTIPLENFKKEVLLNANVSNFILETICYRKRKYAQALGTIAYGNVRKKVSESLLFFRDVFENDSFNISRDDLASRAATAKETLIRTLSDFKAEGIVKIQKNEIALIDIEALVTCPM